MSQGLSSSDEIQEGSRVLLYADERRQWLVTVLKSREFHTHKGVMRLRDLIGKRFGQRVETSLGHSFWILRPTTFDYVMHCERPTQIMYPKDIGLVIVRLGLCSGAKVIEAGTGSGAMTIAAAMAVRPDGRVFTYETRKEFVKTARRNVARAGLEEFVVFKEADAKKGFHESDVDAVILDLGDPWEIVKSASHALKGGRSLVSLSPTFNQVEKTVSALKENAFANIWTLECILRDIRAAEGKTRPASTMVGHTGYLTFANKILT